MVKRLLENFKSFQLTDILGIGNIVGAEEQDSFENYITEILIKFNELPRKERRELLELTNDIAKFNCSNSNGKEDCDDFSPPKS